jgi:hypothetical protein
VISFAIGELGLSSLKAVYDMTWAEFQIRLFAYKRMDLYKWQMQRELMWTSYIAPHQDPKKMVKRKEAFLPLNGEKVVKNVSDEQRQTFMNEFKKYQEKAKLNA